MNEAELLHAIERRARDVARSCMPARDAHDFDLRSMREMRAADVVVLIANLCRRIPRVSPGDRCILRSKLGALVAVIEGGPREGHRLGLEELLRDLAEVVLEDDRADERASIADAFERKVG